MGLGRPYMKIGYKSKKNTNSTVSSLEYIMRENEYSNRDDLFSYKTKNIPAIYHINKENEVQAAKNFFDDFEKYSRKNRRIARTLTFDLPITKEGKSLEDIEPGIYNRIVEGFINNIENFYVINENDEIEKRNDNNKGDPFKIPIAYAIHNLEKEDDKRHPHCHLIIATIGFRENDYEKTNIIPEELFKKGLNHAPLSHLVFFYDIFNLYKNSIIEEIKDIEKEKRDYVAMRFRNIKDYQILNSEKRDWIEATKAFSNLDDPTLSYFDILAQKMAVKSISESIKDIEKKINQEKQNQRFFNTIFDSINSDYYLLRNILKRNDLYDRLLELDGKNIYEFDNFESKANFLDDTKYTTFNGYKILENVTEGFDIKSDIKGIVKRNPIFNNSKDIVSSYYNYGSFGDFNKTVEKKAQNVDGRNNENIKSFINDVNLLTTKYIDAVNTYNRVENFRRTAYANDDIFNTTPVVNVNKNEEKKEKLKDDIISQIAFLDFVIQATLQKRPDNNIIKNFYYGLDSKEKLETKNLTLEEYINQNSEITYEFDGKKITNRLNDAQDSLKMIVDRINLNNKKLNTTSDLVELNQIKKEILGLMNLRDNIVNAIQHFKNTKEKNLKKSFANKKVTVSDTLVKRYEEDIKKYKINLEGKNLKDTIKRKMNDSFEKIERKVNHFVR